MSAPLRNLLAAAVVALHRTSRAQAAQLPKLARGLSSEELRETVRERAEGQGKAAERLARCAKIIGATAEKGFGPAMASAVSEATRLDPSAPDAHLISLLQIAEHTQISLLGSARSFAEALGETKVADLLQDCLDEAGEADKRLTALAMIINEGAAAPEEDPMGE